MDSRTRAIRTYGTRSVRIDVASRYLFELLSINRPSGLSANHETPGSPQMDDALPGSLTTAQDQTALPRFDARINAMMAPPTTGRNHLGACIGEGVEDSVICESA
ncbi:MAG: hypothetical protein V9E94_06600 [Microthrixaceae bacterium]